MSWHQDLPLGMGSAARAIHTPGFTAGLPLSTLILKNGGCFVAPEHLPRDMWHGRFRCSLPARPPCCWSCGRLKDGSQFTELLCSPAHPGKDLSSLIPINQPRFSLLTPGRDHVRVGKLRHRAAGRCQQRLKGLIPFCITKCLCSDSCHNYPRSTGQSFIPSRDLGCERQERSKFNLVYKSHPKMLQEQGEALAEPLAVLLRPWESQRLDLSKASWRSWGLQPLSIAPAQVREG